MAPGESASDPVLTDEYEFKSRGAKSYRLCQNGRPAHYAYRYIRSGSGTPATAGTITIYDGDEWHNVQKQAALSVLLPKATLYIGIWIMQAGSL